ncbi:hypothetical protein F511_25663 [Dorcoceras hygrometricum]|uniref:Uncharacterized protein n=1 Tax=Dorcoceras hygrometricum TaxID=472368 RepID=A0A2Z7ALB9_9LAMI|nr:hypothetical protein F511_25663 [Dorcoceras hygrometricum]
MAARRCDKRSVFLRPPCAMHGAQPRELRTATATMLREAAGHRPATMRDQHAWCRARGVATALRGGAGGRHLAPTSFTRKPALQKHNRILLVKRIGKSPITATAGHGGGATAHVGVGGGVRKSHSLKSSPIRSTTIGKSRVARDLIAMHTSWRSNSDIASVTRQNHLPKTHPVLWPEIYHTIASSDNIGYPWMRASGESSTKKHRLLHASGPHPIPPPNDSKTNQYNQDLGIIHSTNGNHLESQNEGSSIDHQVTIHMHSQNITMFPTNETWYFTSQMLVSSSHGLILILMAQSTRNEFRMHSDY